MWVAKDKTGQRFGRLTVIRRAENDNAGKAQWLCRCDCGTYKVIRSGNLKETSKTKSCGCLKRELLHKQKNGLKHGMYGTRIYTEWASMKWRCYCEKNTSYERYGGRGIKVCDEWLNDFLPFYNWAMSSGYRDDLTLDRIDNNGDYRPDNCRWVTMKVQDNNKRNNKFYEHDGKRMTGSQWSEYLGAKDRHLISDRIDRGWSIERALSTPAR